jgi:anaphase-promoting complex subunit 1
VRSGSSSAGDAATLDFPQLTDTKTHPAGDITEFISSFSNDVLFLAFADHFCREDGDTEEEKIFHTYCHATLLDSILQDKPQTLQTHLTLYRYRTMSPRSRYHNLRLQDLKFAAEFYKIVYDRRFSGRSENNHRPPLIREGTVLGALHSLDERLNTIRAHPQFPATLCRYASGEEIIPTEGISAQNLAWYLLRENVPGSTILALLKGLAQEAHAQCLSHPPPQGIVSESNMYASATDTQTLDIGIKEVLHSAGGKMINATGAGWSVRSLDEIIEAWKVDC